MKHLADDPLYRAPDAFMAKLDLFMRLHILKRFKPDEICWWLSLSGGKDSFAMAHGLRRWYLDRQLAFNAVLFTIDQWHGEAPAFIRQQIQWAPVHVIDGRQLTLNGTHYKTGQQAPCRACADVRRDLTDVFMSNRTIRAGMDRCAVNILARGLHLTDTSVSALWRFVFGKDPASDMTSAGKAKPIAELREGTFLAKPLYYIREFECQQYALETGYRAACCGCPACKFPSRRDIVEESVAGLIRNPLWEFDVPGMQELILQFAPAVTIPQLKATSAPGIESKHAHLPREFALSVARRHLTRWASSASHLAPIFDSAVDLDEIGARRLRYQTRPCAPAKLPMPALFRNEVNCLSESHLMVIATLGPFWGAIGLSDVFQDLAWHIQRVYFGMSIDETWSQVGDLLREYYGQQQPTPISPSAFVDVRRLTDVPRLAPD